MIQSKVKPNTKQMNMIYKLYLLSFSLEEIEDIVLFNNNTIKVNPIYIDEVEEVYNFIEDKGMITAKLSRECKDIILKNPAIKLKEANKLLKLNVKSSKKLPTLTALRKDKKLSRIALGNKCYIEPMTLYHYEKGKRSINFINSLVLSHFYNKNIGEISWNL